MAEGTTVAAGEGWPEILDRLETSISLAFAGEEPGWEPPAEDPGPIPAELLDRAVRLLDARREAELMLTAQQATTGRHLGAVNAVPAAEHRSRLLDVTG